MNPAAPDLESTWRNRLFGIDRRALPVFRVGLALLILADLLSRARSLPFFYTDSGLIPRADLIEGLIPDWQFSLHAMNGTAGFQIAMFVVAAIAATALLAGFHTRLATGVSWLLLVSLQARAPILNGPGDFALAGLLFWSLFLPLGASWSFDRALNQADPPLPRRFVTLGAAAYLLHVTLLYFGGGLQHLLDTDGIWQDGSALLYALKNNHFARLAPADVDAHAAGLAHAAHGILAFELATPLFFLLPWGGTLWRWLWVLVAGALAVFQGNTLHLGLYPAVALVSLIPLLPTGFWEAATRWIDRRFPRDLRMYYDGPCGFCLRSARLIRCLLLLEPCSLQPAQADASIAADMQQRNSWILIDRAGNRHYEFDAALLAAAQSPLLFWLAPLLRLPPLFQIGAFAYRRVARHRDWAGERTSLFRVHDNPVLDTGARYGTLAFRGCVAAMIFSLWVAAGNAMPALRPPAAFQAVVQALHWEKPVRPLTNRQDFNGWWVMPARLWDGTEFDILTGQDISWDKPADFRPQALDHRWRRYWYGLRQPANSEYRELWCRTQCRTWNRTDRSDDADLFDFSMVYMIERNLPGGKIGKPESQKLYNWKCPAE